MKNKLKIFVPAGLVVLALVCVIMVRQGDPGQGDMLGAQQSVAPAEETPNANKDPVEEVIYTLPPIPSTAPVYTATPETGPDSSPAGEQVTTEPDGTVVITPDWQEQIDKASKIVTPGSQVTANIGGGGGELELGKDGAFHGDNKPTPAPAASQQPGSSQKPAPAATPSPAPTTAPVVNTPAPVESSSPTVPPVPTPTQGTQEGNGPPSYNGTYDGQISPDGQYAWIGGFGWIKRGGSDGGIGGQIDDSDKGWAPGEMGETVGAM